MPVTKQSHSGKATTTAKRTARGAEPALELRPSPIQGTGAFATRWIRKGEKVVEYTGEKISNAEADRRYDDEKMRRHHTFLFILNSRSIIDGGAGGNEARFINHSCDPNCEAVIYDNRHIWIEAIRDIAPGEELLYDYQYERTDDHTDEDEEFYACHCGADGCRGTILAPPKKRSKPHHARVKSGARKRGDTKAAAKRRSRAKRVPPARKGPPSRGTSTKRGSSAKRTAKRTPSPTRSVKQAGRRKTARSRR
jgi:uncharacterized protein